MAFEEFLKEAEGDMDKREKKDLEKSKGLIAVNYHDRLIQYWIGYKTIESNKKLVWATWILAFATIGLAIATFLLVKFG